MKSVSDLQSYLRGIYEIPEPSTDHIVYGDPSADIGKIGTCWMPYAKTLKGAGESGVRTMVVHEPLFYSHNDLTRIDSSYSWGSEEVQGRYNAQVQAKKSLLDAYGMSVIRCHDVPDSMPEFGIPFAWGKQLGFDNSDIRGSAKYLNVYSLAPRKAIDVARSVASRVRNLGQSGVAFWGDEERIVTSIGVGTGCYCTPISYGQLQADMYVAIDDTIRDWVEAAYAADSGQPLVVVNHGTSEEPGVRELSAFLKRELAPIEVVHFPQGCSYRWVN